MAKLKRVKRKQYPYKVDQIIENLENGEFYKIGVLTTMGNEKAEAVVAQYTWFLKHPKDPRRIELLEMCYAKYRKSLEQELEVKE